MQMLLDDVEVGSFSRSEKASECSRGVGDIRATSEDEVYLSTTVSVETASHALSTVSKFAIYGEETESQRVCVTITSRYGRNFLWWSDYCVFMFPLEIFNRK